MEKSLKKIGNEAIGSMDFKVFRTTILKTIAHKNEGELFIEVDVYIDDFRKRVPDLAYFTEPQIIAMAKGQKEVPAFAIEILSPSESVISIENKLTDYIDAGVQLVWYILPKNKKIYAYTALN